MRAYRYRIIVSGDLSETGREVFGDFDIQSDGAGTALAGDLDQAALAGTLNRVLSLGLELVEVRRLSDDMSPTLSRGYDISGRRHADRRNLSK